MKEPVTSYMSASSDESGSSDARLVATSCTTMRISSACRYCNMWELVLLLSFLYCVASRGTCERVLVFGDDDGGQATKYINESSTGLCRNL